jgi:CRISPR-associated protein Cas2
MHSWKQQFMRVIVLFDLPVTSKKARRNYTRFRSFLLRDGYDMLQFSVYSRLCNGLDNVDKHLIRMERELPPEGSIRTIVLTDKQFSRMRLWVGVPSIHEKKVNAEQLVLL